MLKPLIWQLSAWHVTISIKLWQKGHTWIRWTKCFLSDINDTLLPCVTQQNRITAMYWLTYMYWHAFNCTSIFKICGSLSGAWPSQPDDGNLINSSDLSRSREVFAVGDELGYIRLFRFPCSQPGVGGGLLYSIGKEHAILWLHSRDKMAMLVPKQ